MQRRVLGEQQTFPRAGWKRHAYSEATLCFRLFYRLKRILDLGAEESDRPVRLSVSR